MMSQKSKKCVAGLVLTGSLFLYPVETAAASATHMSVRFVSRTLPTAYSTWNVRRPLTTKVIRVEKPRYGSIDFNIRPQKSRIYINGQLLGVADDFNGYPQTAKLLTGYYNVRVVSPRGQVEKRRVYVAMGQELNFNFRF